MKKFQVTFLLALTSLIVGTCVADVPKPSYARTTLKVSRSLPGETEELKVRTSEGSLTTLIVKRRDRSSYDETKVPNEFNERQNQRVNIEGQTKDTNVQEDLASSESRKKEEIRRLEEAQIQQIRAKLSETGEQNNPNKSTNSNQNEESFHEGSRVNTERVIDYGNWTPLGEDGRALKLDELSTTEEYQSWKPLSADFKTSTEQQTSYARFSEPPYPGGLVLARSFQDRSQRNLEFEDRKPQINKSPHYAFFPHQTHPARTNIGANTSKNRDAKNVPPEVTVRSELSVKSSPKRTPMSLDRDGTPVIHGKRVPDEPMDKFQTWRNARVINNKLIHEGPVAIGSEKDVYQADESEERQRFERLFKNINRRYGRNFDEDGRNVFFEWDPKNYKNEALKAEVYESRNENYRSNLHKRMLHPDGIATYPNSQLYTPESQKIAPVGLKPGARAPVLQYAHPELGVQPAKILKNEKRRPDNFPENQHSFTEQRQKKKYVLNDKNIVDTYTTKNYYPNQHFYGLKRPSDAPFWVKISENLKNQFSTGVEKVSQFTRPVIDPLVEATHKISQNLGLSKGKEAQDKVGTVTSGTSILIPALGLVASGAALGIGAVAVGRYLDVDVLKRSNDANGLDLEHRRSLEAIQSFPANLEFQAESIERTGKSDEPIDAVYVLESLGDNERNGKEDGVLVVLKEDQNVKRDEDQQDKRITAEVDTTERRKRSADYLDVFKAEKNLKSLIRSKRLQRKGADSISEIVEIDLPMREGNIDVTELIIPRKESVENNEQKRDTILVVEDESSQPLLTKNVGVEISDPNFLQKVTQIVEDVIADEDSKNLVDERKERRRRSTESEQELEDILQNLENAEISEVAHVDGDWTNTPCAKRIFCDAMIKKGTDEVIFMEKKMAALLGLIQSGPAVQVSSHFDEVMSAVKRHDCSRFMCPQARPGNVFF